MNRNKSTNFNVMPSVGVKRSVIERDFTHKTTLNAADIVPFYVEEVLPGTSISLKSAAMVRMTTAIHPTMDKAYIDTYWFFVSSRLTWKGWEEFLAGSPITQSSTTRFMVHGGNPGDWTVKPEGDGLIPVINNGSAGQGLATNLVTVGSLFDYMGIPIVANPSANTYFKNINALPFIAYQLIYNNWFRSESLQSQVNDFVTLANYNMTGYVSPSDCVLRKACKLHDYFTSATISPQCGQSVNIPVGDSAPVGFVDDNNNFLSQSLYNFSKGDDTSSFVSGFKSSETNGFSYGLDLRNNIEGPYSAANGFISDNNLDVTYGINYPVIADLSNAAGITVNQLRLLVQTQKFLEKNAMYGTRMAEIIKAHFGCTLPDYRAMIPEYLGGNRTLLDMRQITQTSATDTTSNVSSTPLGEVAGQSVTVDKAGGFVKSFVEHGYLLGLLVIRPVHTYQYGIKKMFSRRTRLDFYWPVFANIGFQPILNKEIYAQGNSQDDEVFGYQEAWSEYRYTPSRVSGYFRSNSPQPLDSWHYADKYSQLPHLGSDWIQETPDNIDRTLAVQSSASHQFIANIEVRSKWTVPMPVNSIPGLIDHF